MKKYSISILESNTIIQNTETKEIIKINKEGKINKLETPKEEKINPKNVETTIGIIGMIKLLNGYYIIYIHEYEEIGMIYGQLIYKIKSFKINNLNTTNSSLSTTVQKNDEKNYLELINSFLQNDSFYFSKDVDLTLNFQNIILNDNNKVKKNK
jgi:hypothetical protein